MIARKAFSVAWVGLLALVPSVAFAQLATGSLGLGSSGSPFTMTLSPSYPAPNTSATLSFVSTSGLDLSNATLTVAENGTHIYSGSAQTIAVPVGAAGALSTIRATITSNGTSYTQTLALRPQDVSLVLEPLSSAPPLYPGKPLVPAAGEVRVVAVANLRTNAGVQVNPTTLSYSWTMDGVRLANFSGIGKDALLAAAPLQYRSHTISVVVQSQDGALVGGGSVTFESADPTLLLYDDDPLLGILFDHALSGTYALTGTESTLYAAPYSLPTSGSPSSVQWFVNESAAQTGPLLTVRPVGQGAGTASISATEAAGPYTTAAANLTVTFGTTTSSFLGL